MRTTIEMKSEHRARVLELAAIRGEKGFSAVVGEAIEFYLESQNDRQKTLKDALALRGSLKEAEAASLLAESRKIRANWR